MDEWEPVHQINLETLHNEYLSDKKRGFYPESAEQSFSDPAKVHDSRIDQLKKIHDFIYARLDEQQNAGMRAILYSITKWNI